LVHFPPGRLDADSQQLDLRPRNSWTARLEDVAPVELAETHCVNALAPFLLLRRLLPAFRRSSHARKFVVNVAAREGQFDRAGGQAIHPHTNMAKAALNMLTRTAADDLAAEGIFACSVDPGWVSDQRPIRPAQREESFVPPLDAIDGAARILDPVFAGVTEAGEPLHGVLLKDFEVVNW
jgi:NAD(P)-dependent dehydrogenase (short-subunit alcohol dehydrogenase family)